ncbi:23S rRNA (adenine(2503)-C(2))-methyltransferase RlmN [Marispirochaeta aestuarii]|uniref:23S rRNA (adenine(2503)-C(2))-methyltransferase RlmN n=1 Tax=Marispirochaeta aestuarii TaxID=1963862 RepID=UPI002ABD7CDA|nr:23S rRNA (adenine(2503)-C(2))-methyltransferase RlmN [Marispirochaeta aestuarii]
MQSLLALLPREISGVLASEPAFRGRQIFSWIHQKNVRSFGEMTDLPKPLRQKLETEHTILTSHIDVVEEADDGTVKIRLKLGDGSLIEAVLLRDAGDRVTACLSTQVGCAMGCRFCKTATMGFIRNLDAGEIIEQLYLLEETAGGKSIDNIVFMGMGEPFKNYDELSKTIKVLTHPEGRNMGLRRITISTSGLVEGINRLVQEHPQVRLAVSLVSAEPVIRKELMPVEIGNPLPRLKEALLEYQKAGGRRITLEYVLLKDINDRKEDPGLVRKFANGLRCNINLIPWNPAEGIPPVNLPGKGSLPLEEPDSDRLDWFQKELEKLGLTVVLRRRKGRGVNAACGQLATKGKIE